MAKDARPSGTEGRGKDVSEKDEAVMALDGARHKSLIAITSRGTEVSIIRPLNDFRDKFFKIWARFAKIYLLGLSKERAAVWKPILKQLSIGRRWFKFLRFTRSIPDLVEDRTSKPFWRQALETSEVATDMLSMVMEDNNSLHRIGVYGLLGMDQPHYKDYFQYIEDKTWNMWTILAIPVSFLSLKDSYAKFQKAIEKDPDRCTTEYKEVREKLILSFGKCVKAVTEFIESCHDCGYIEAKKTSIFCGMLSGCASFYKAISKARRIPVNHKPIHSQRHRG